ncbi:MAG: hypothetical protein PHF65_07465 [Oscillospiraceae bacterium]|nr:hypothetical protein [Oscillospiraceae bacterium]
MNIECRTLLYHMMKNRPNGMRREEAISALSIPDLDPDIDRIRNALLEELEKTDEASFLSACKDAALHHFEEEKT